MTSSRGEYASWVSLGGCRADLMDMEEAVSHIADRCARGAALPLGVVSLNLDHLKHFGPASPWRHTFDPACSTGDLEWLHLLDGAPLVAQARRLTGRDWPRLAGSDLIEPVLSAARARGASVGFLGGTAEAHALLPARLPGLRIAGCWAPARAHLADPVAARALAEEVRRAGVDLLVVGLGKPRQELWIAEYGARTGAGALLAFGAVVDFLAGRVPRAPEWVSWHSLEWAWRLAHEPKRLSRRYLVQGPPAYVSLRRGPVPSAPRVPAPRPAVSWPGAFVGPDDRADVAVLVVTYNSAEHVDALLASLRAEARDHRMRVVVADNCSDDGTLALVQRHRDVVAFSTGGNLGYAAGVNLARRRAGRAGSLLVLNPDLTVSPGAVAALRRRLARPGVGAVVPRIVDLEGRTALSLRREPSVARALGDAVLGDHLAHRPHWFSEVDRSPESYLHPHVLDWATGAAVLVDASVAEQVGDWDEGFFLYVEETDFFRRVRAAGHTVWFEPAATVRHVQGGSGASPGLTALANVNRVRYMERYASRRAPAFRTAIALGEALRMARPDHRAALGALLHRTQWPDLPHAPSEESSAPGWALPSGSVVIPAHDEAAVLARTLRPIAPFAAMGSVEVVVACNGCTDGTAAVARSFDGVTVLELPEASKAAALNAADRVAVRWPRLYLDADVEISAQALHDLFAALAGGRLRAARPPFEYALAADATPVVRSYYRARQRLFADGSQLWGSGAYAMSQAGRARFGDFPDLTADDLFVDSLFDEDEKAVVDTAPVRVHVPRDVAGLVPVLRRSYRGNRELAVAGGPPAAAGGVGRLLRSVRRPDHVVDAVAYGLLAVTGRTAARTSGYDGWERDDSSRPLT